MKIAYFTSLYTTPGSGPASIARYLKDYNKELLQITIFSDDRKLDLSNNDVFIKRPSFYFPGYWIFRSLRFYLNFKKRKKDFSIVICSNAFEALFFTLFNSGIPLIVMVNDDNYLFTRFYPQKAIKQQTFRKFLSRYLGFFIEKWVTERAKMVVVCSHYLKNEIIKKYKKPASAVKVLYPAVDQEFFRFSVKGITKNEFSILFLKQDWRRGGLEVLAEAMARSQINRKIILRLGGISADYKKEVGKLIFKSGFKGKIEWLGILSKSEVREAFQKADVLILPSRQEAFGMAILEAFASGTPVVASNTGGIPEVSNNGKTAFLVEPDSPEELAQLIDQLFYDQLLLKSRIGGALEYSKQFSKNRLYSCLEEICLSANEIDENNFQRL